MRLIVATLLLLALAACQSVPVAVQRATQAEAPFAFNGRVAIKQQDRRESAGLRWVHGASEEEILLLAPLGQTVARIHRNDQGVTLEASGRTHVAADAEQLMQQVLGWHFPLTGLGYWVTGSPAPASEFHLERNAQGQPAKLQQQGWEITYSRYAASTAEALPLRVSLRRGGMEVLLLIDEWEAQ